MATQSFMKTFSVNRKNAKLVAEVLNSSKKVEIKRDFTVKAVKKENIREFLGMETCPK